MVVSRVNTLYYNCHVKENAMKQITDRMILLIYCFSSVFWAEINMDFLTAFLCAVICSCLHFYIGRREFRLLLSLLYLILMIPVPESTLFFPVILYGSMMDSNRVLAVITGILPFLRFSGSSWQLLYFLMIGMLLALLLSYHTLSYLSLEQQFKKIRDDSVERNILLKEKNQALLEKQDYEIYTATLQERNRIAREIHDNVGHMLSRSILLTGAVKTITKDKTIAPSLEQLENTLNAAMTNVRESVHDLHNESVNLKEALESLTEAFTFCPVLFEYDMGYEVPKAVKYCLIAVVKESLNNVMRHSNANRVQIILREHPGLYQLIIEDNGIGNPSGKEDGLGLINMKDRITALHGMLQIHTDNGFRIFITIPKREDYQNDKNLNR